MIYGQKGLLPMMAQAIQFLKVQGQLMAASQLSTVTVRIPVGTCSLPASSLTEVLYTTTNSLGSVITTSSPSYVVFYPGTEITYTTTDSMGSTIMASTFSDYTIPTPLPSTVITFSTTNSAGLPTTEVATVLVSSTGSSPSGSSSTVSSPIRPVTTGSPSFPCQESIATPFFLPDGTEWLIFCTADFYYNDLPAVNASTFAACIAACAAYVPAPAPDA